jgi:hypothetical protein
VCIFEAKVVCIFIAKLLCILAKQCVGKDSPLNVKASNYIFNCYIMLVLIWLKYANVKRLYAMCYV